MLASLLLLAAAQAAPAPPPAPPCTAAEYRSLDFWVGEWELSFRQSDGSTGHAVNRITRDELGACVISEHFEQADIGYVGMSHSTWDRARKQWVQTWVDNQGGYITLAGGPVQGESFSFRLDTIEPRGPAKAHFRMIWQNVTPGSLTWRWQQRRPDGSYVDSWVIDYVRK
jgi:hypothetical protein